MMKKLTVLSICAVCVGACAFWIAVFHWASPSPDAVTTSIYGAARSTSESAVTAPMNAAVPGVPANTLAQAAKVTRDLREAAFAYERGITVERNHDTAVILKARADSISELIDEIEREPVTGKPADAEKKLVSLKALRSIAKLDEDR